MLCRQGSHGLEEVLLRIVALVGGRADIGRVGVAALRETGEAPREQARSHGHDELLKEYEKKKDKKGKKTPNN